MALQKNPIAIVLAVAVTTAGIVGFGDPSAIANELSQHSGKMVWVLPMLLGVTYMVSERQIGELSNIELGAILIPVAAMVGMNEVAQINDVVVNNEPISQVALIGLSAASVYVLMEN